MWKMYDKKFWSTRVSMILKPGNQYERVIAKTDNSSANKNTRRQAISATPVLKANYKYRFVKICCIFLEGTMGFLYKKS